MQKKREGLTGVNTSEGLTSPLGETLGCDIPRGLVSLLIDPVKGPKYRTISAALESKGLSDQVWLGNYNMAQVAKLIEALDSQ